MDKNRIKKFAIWARTELIMRVTQRAYYYGVDGESQPNPEAGEINGRLFTEDECRKRRKLVQRVQKKGFQPVMEEAAYTWFNRFAALRYMEVNGVLPTRVRVFSSREGAFAPQILDECLTMENLEGLDKSVLFDLKEKDATEELYKYLLITQCNALGSILPVMFRQIEDYTELLLPDNLLREGSVIHQLVTEIEEEDWRDAVQMIGWLYQYYNSEPKDAVFAALKKNIKVSKENIPAATQLFTPDWIVRYMVENSLGRLWLEGHHPELIPLPWRGGAEGAGVVLEGDVSPLNHPALTGTPPQEGNRLLHEWKYYLPEAPQDTEVAAKLQELRASRADLRPEDIKLIDPCMGSGHILVYAFDVLVQIYKDAGYREKDIPEFILKHNLYGLDIDDRAYQLAYFAVMMRAWNYNHRILVKRIEPNLCAIQESNGLGKWSELNMDMSGTQQLNLESQFVQLADELIEKFQDAKEYGSILDVEEKNYGALLTYIKELQENSVLDLSMAAWLHEVGERLPGLVKQAQIMGQKYDIVVTNPPYMGSNNMSDGLSKWVKKKYPASKNDLFACFIEKCGEISKKNGFVAMITQHTWMFLSSFEKLRQKLLQKSFVNMVHLGARAFEEIGGEVVQTTSFVMANVHIEKFLGTYSRMVNLMTQREKEISFLKRENIFLYKQENFNVISGSPIAYWVSEKLLNIFADKTIDSQSKACIGMRTGDNERFLRLWFEVDSKKTLFDGNSANDVIENEKKWIPYNKGGEYRKWYGNQEYVVNWEDNGLEIKENTKRVYPQLGDNLGWKISNEALYFKSHICWTDITTKGLSFRMFPNGFIFDASVNVVFTKEDYFTLISYLNSKVVDNIAQILNPTLHFKLNNYNSIPMLISCEEKVQEISKQCVDISKVDWDSFETSWDFKCHPLIPLPWRGGAEGDGVVTESTFLAGDHPGLTATPPQEGNGKRFIQHYMSLPYLIPLPWRGGAEGDGVVTESAFSAGDHPGLTGTPPQEGNGKRSTQHYMSLPYNPKLKERARELRKAGNLSEVLLWNRLKQGKVKGADFDRQKIIGNYIVDFFCASAALVVEIDGSSHDDKQEYDKQRDAFLKGLGLKVLRFLDEDVKSNIEGVVTTIANLIPLPWRGGAVGDGVVTESTFSAGDHPGLTATPPQEGNGGRLADCYEAYKQVTNKCFDTLKKNEEELNRIFIDIYGLSDELTPNVADKDVTVARIYDTKEEIPDSMKGNNYVLTREDVVKSLISYAVGCMFGRYSLDEPGLICAGGEFDPSKYETYHPDEDAIIPICDDEYFEDDIVERFCIWLKAAFGEEHYRENLQFIADALEGKGTPLETIRSYFLSDFYTDHCKRYQKRPIYWLFDAGKKNSFKALVYIHRYDKDTIARMRTGYVYKQQELYKTRIETTQNRIDTAASQTDKNKFKRELKKLHEQFDEIHVYEEKIHHYADLRQEIDLDDGVKHNYALFADILAKIK